MLGQLGIQISQGRTSFLLARIPVVGTIEVEIHRPMPPGGNVVRIALDPAVFDDSRGGPYGTTPRARRASRRSDSPRYTRLLARLRSQPSMRATAGTW